MTQPRLSEMPKYKVERFNELKRTLRTGKIPAFLLNPEIIEMHNRCNPPVAQIVDGMQEVSLDGLVLMYVHDGESTRKFFNHFVSPIATKREPEPEPELEIKHDPAHHKVQSRQDRHMFIGDDRDV